MTPIPHLLEQKRFHGNGSVTYIYFKPISKDPLFQETQCLLKSFETICFRLQIAFFVLFYILEILSLFHLHISFHTYIFVYVEKIYFLYLYVVF